MDDGDCPACETAESATINCKPFVDDRPEIGPPDLPTIMALGDVVQPTGMQISVHTIVVRARADHDRGRRDFGCAARENAPATLRLVVIWSVFRDRGDLSWDRCTA
jgi:hypothetical protein